MSKLEETFSISELFKYSMLGFDALHYIDQENIPGDFGGNAHKGTRWHSMQSFGGLFHSKITWVGTGLTEGCTEESIFIEMECILLRFPTYVIGSSLAEIVKIEIHGSQIKMMWTKIWLWGKTGRQNFSSKLNLIGW